MSFHSLYTSIQLNLAVKQNKASLEQNINCFQWYPTDQTKIHPCKEKKLPVESFSLVLFNYLVDMVWHVEFKVYRVF